MTGAAAEAPWRFAGYVHGPQSAVGILTDVTEAPEPPTLAPFTVEMAVHLAPLGEAFARATECVLAMDPWLHLLAAKLARPRRVDRARAQRIDRAMRLRARRADRRRRRGA